MAQPTDEASADLKLTALRRGRLTLLLVLCLQ